jgi:hypothetical protein
MTVNTISIPVSAAGNGVTTNFPYSYRFLADADLVVLLVDATTGVQTAQTLTTHYTVSGAGAAGGGSVTFVTAPPTGTNVVIYEDPTITQAVHVVPNDALPVDTAIETPLDRLTLIAQRQAARIDRSVRLPEGDSGFAATDMMLPAKVVRASTYFAFDANGKPMAASAAQTGTPASAFAATLLDDTSASAALTTLGGVGEVATLSALKALTVANLTAGQLYATLGYTTIGDGGGALYRWNASDTGTDNGGTIIRPTSAPATGRWNLVYNGTINLKWFGATGDNSTDNATPFLNAWASGAKDFYLPPGTYKLSAESVVNLSGFRLVGGGMTSTIITLTSTSASKAILRWSSFVQGVIIEGVRFNLTGAGATQIGLRFAEARAVRISKCEFFGIGTTGDDTTAIQFDGTGTFTGDVTVNRCYITNHKIGVDLQGTCTTVRIVHSELFGTSGASTTKGIKIANTCIGVLIEGNTFQNWTRGVYSDGVYITQVGNYFETNTVNWEWVRGSGNARIWGAAIGEKLISGGTPVYPQNNVDNCIQVGAGATVYFDNAIVNAGVGFLERGRTVNMGEWTTPTYAAGDFTASASMTWTVDSGDVTTYEYTLVGKKMTVNWFLQTTTIGGSVDVQLKIKIPGGFTAAKRVAVPFWFGNSADGTGLAEVAAAGTVINLYRTFIASTNWTLGTNNVYVLGSITFEVQ